MSEHPQDQEAEKPSNPLIPVKSIMEWKPPSETTAAVTHLVGDLRNQLLTYKNLCGKDHQ